MAPDAYELVFWQALELAKRGDLAAARREMAIAVAADEAWRHTLEHLGEGRARASPRAGGRAPASLSPLPEDRPMKEPISRNARPSGGAGHAASD